MRLRPSLLFVAAAASPCREPIPRSLALTRVLGARFDITVVTSVPPPRGLDESDGISWVHLPATVADDPRRPAPVRRRSRVDERGRILREIYRSVRPRVLMIERDAVGRGTLAAEFQPLLHDVREWTPTLVCCSVRDDLVGRFDLSKDADAGCLQEYFDAVLVHSDPRFARADELAVSRMPMYYTGFVQEDTRRESPPRARLPQGALVVSAGHDAGGEALARATIEAYSLLPARPWPALSVVAGPRMPDSRWRRLQALAEAHPHVQLRRSVSPLAAELGRAAGSISEGGYHAAIDVLRSQVPALVVPSDGPAGEQARRARRLEALGAVRVVPGSELTPRRLAHELVLLAEFAPTSGAFDFTGADRSARILEALCQAGMSRRSTVTAQEVAW